MKEKHLWINQIKGLCICLVVVYHSVITFYPHLPPLESSTAQYIAKAWIYFNLYLAPFRMPVFFFISGFLVTRYVDSVPWRNCLDKRLWSILWVLALWGIVQWQAIGYLNYWLAPERVLPATNAAYASDGLGFLKAMAVASTSLWYLYALVVYFTLCKFLQRWRVPVLLALVLISIGINFMPTPYWGLNSVIRNMVYYSLGAWFGHQVIQAVVNWHPGRRSWLLIPILILAVALYFKNVNLLLSLCSIVMVMKGFQLVQHRWPLGFGRLLDNLGANTIAIYTTHRIIIEALSLVMLGIFERKAWPEEALLWVLVCYPAFSLMLCAALGLMLRALSRRLARDFFFTPPRLPASAR